MKSFDFSGASGDNERSLGGKMRPFIIMALLGVLLIGFQNCGQGVRTQGIFAEDSSNTAVNDNCDNSFCVTPAELLWIKIRESDPYIVSMADLNQGHFTVGGTCGVGTFQSHSVVYELREAFGAQDIASSGFVDNICDVGQFQIAIAPTAKQFEVDSKYLLTLEIVGLGEGNEPISNPMPANISRIDVVFESGL